MAAGSLQSDVVFNDEWHLRRIINKMVAQVGRRIDESSPMVDARLPDGSRVNAVIPPLSLSGPLITIRKFSRRRLTLDDMIKLGTLSQETVEFLQRCIKAQLNMLISGGTGSGKTTLLNALSTAIPNEERIVTIEDAAELRLNQDHVLRLEARPKDLAGENEIPIRMLVRNSLRMRPDRIIVGEVRGAEALDMLQAMNTGHDGSLSTIHSNSPRDALARVETMVLMAGYDLPVRAIREQVSSALECIIHLERLEDGSRRVTSVTEVQGMESDVITLQELFKFQIDEVTRDGTIVGGLRATGLRPTFLQKFEKRGIALPLGLFQGPEPEFGCGGSCGRRPGEASSRSSLRSSRPPQACSARRPAQRGSSARAWSRPRARPSRCARYVLSLPSGRKLTTADVGVTENGNPVVEPTLVPASQASKQDVRHGARARHELQHDGRADRGRSRGRAGVRRPAQPERATRG